MEALVARCEDLAKGWLVALIEDAPLPRLPDVPVADLAREGPGLCAAVVRALADDGELERLGELGERTARLTGADGIEPLLGAIEALRSVIWSAAYSELRDPSAEQVAELAERLSAIAERIRRAALRRFERRGAGAWPEALDAEIARADRSGSPLSLLVAELEDAGRIVFVDGSPSAESTLAWFMEAVREGAGGARTFSEGGATVWIVAADTDRASAEQLAERVADAVRAGPRWRDAPLGVTVGVAVLGEDGDDSAGLIEAAEQARFAAEASGITIVRGGAPVGGSGPPGDG